MKSRRLVRTYKQVIKGKKDKVFKLLCPERETEWLEGWTYKMIYSESGYAEKGCVFETSNNFGSFRWVMTKYDDNDYGVQFVKVIQDNMIVIIDIELLDNDHDTIFCLITYTFTATNDDVIETMYLDNSQEIFDSHMQLWEDSMNHYLATGEKLM